MLVDSWYLSGQHYSRTLEDWLTLQDSNRAAGLEILERNAEAQGMPAKEGRKAFMRYAISAALCHNLNVAVRFRVFYMACSELFNMNGGEE